MNVRDGDEGNVSLFEGTMNKASIIEFHRTECVTKKNSSTLFRSSIMSEKWLKGRRTEMEEKKRCGTETVRIGRTESERESIVQAARRDDGNNANLSPTTPALFV